MSDVDTFPNVLYVPVDEKEHKLSRVRNRRGNFYQELEQKNEEMSLGEH